MSDSDSKAGRRERMESFLDAGMRGMPDLLDALESELAAGPETGAHRRVGPYRVLQSIGRGGMGAVYLAERADQAFDKRVALKLLPWGLDSETLRERFVVERQILASLEHPNIARLLDGGTTEDNLPYIVMEWVDGEPVDRYCDRNRPGVRGLLELFLAVCAAVHYAHQNLVVHRDLKPGNVLVDGAGNVKLLDFGIAKLLTERGGAEATLTGLHPLTPEYAAPEQLRGEQVTTATDVYALGVMLYRLLAGRRPFELEGAGLDTVIRTICESEPEAPSRAAPAERSRYLRGDLDAIVGKAMAKFQRDRYSSVAGLAEDLRRHLDGQPIAARAPTPGYRMRKFLRRHRVGVSATAAVILALATGLGVALWQAQERADAARLARQEAERAEHVSEFLVSLFEAADPAQSGGETVTVREVFRRGALRIREELELAPALRADLLYTMALIAQRLGDHDSGLELVEESLRTREQLYGAGSPQAAAALRLEGSLLGVAGDSEQAREVLSEALAIDRGHPDGAPGAVADDLVELASLAIDSERPGEAKPLLEEAQAIRQNAPGNAENRAERARIRGQLAIVARQEGRLPDASALYREALSELETELGAHHPETVRTRNSLAALLFHQGQYGEAETLFRTIEADSVRVFGEDHPLTATVRNNLAAVLLKQDKAGEAIERFEFILDYWRGRVGDDHPRSIITQVNLGSALRGTGRLEEAESLIRDALTRFQALYGNDNPYVAITLTHLAETLLARGDGEAARRHAERALGIVRKAHEGAHPQVASVHHALGRISRYQSRIEAATDHFKTARDMREAVLGAGHPDTRESRRALAELRSPQ